MSTPNTIPTLLASILNLVPTAQCAVISENPGTLTDGSTISEINGLYVIWAPNNGQVCPTEDQINA